MHVSIVWLMGIDHTSIEYYTVEHVKQIIKWRILWDLTIIVYKE